MSKTRCSVCSFCSSTSLLHWQLLAVEINFTSLDRNPLSNLFSPILGRKRIISGCSTKHGGKINFQTHSSLIKYHRLSHLLAISLSSLSTATILVAGMPRFLLTESTLCHHTSWGTKSSVTCPWSATRLLRPIIRASYVTNGMAPGGAEYGSGTAHKPSWWLFGRFIVYRYTNERTQARTHSSRPSLMPSLTH